MLVAYTVDFESESYANNPDNNCSNIIRVIRNGKEVRRSDVLSAVDVY